MITAEQFSEPIASHGEGPVWDAAWPGLRLVDMLRGDLLTLDVRGRLAERRHLSSVLAAIRPRRGGGLVIATERGFALLDEELRCRAEITVWPGSRTRMNDGGCDPDGNFYAGSMAYDMTPGYGSLYRLGSDGNVTTVLADVGCSNGLAWSPDGSRAYYIDSLTQRVDVLDYSPEHGLTGRRGLVTIPASAGLPDGLATDSDGGIWVALFGGAAVHRYTPTGLLDEVVSLPVTQVTACAFGGKDFAELFITTSRYGLSPGQQPVAGAVYRCTTGVRGAPVHAFAG